MIRSRPTDFRKLAVCAPGCMQGSTRSIKLRKWNRYEITMTHLGTSPAYLENLLRHSGP